MIHRDPVAKPARLSAPTTIFIIGLLLTFGLGWGLATIIDNGGSKPLKVVGHLTGTITAVDVDGSAICITPSKGGAQHCSIPLMRPGQPKLQMGQRVEVSIQRLDLGGGSSEEVFVVTNPGPGT
jgi:hypothetical protein